MQNDHRKVDKKNFYIPLDGERLESKPGLDEPLDGERFESKLGLDEPLDVDYERIQSAGRVRSLRGRMPDFLLNFLGVKGAPLLVASIGILLVVCVVFGLYQFINGNAFNSKAVVAPVYDDQYADEGETVASDVSDRDKTVVCLDAGHGGNDSGAEYKKTYEKDQCLEMVKLVRTELENEGYTVVLTRDSDTNPSLNERVGIAEAANAAVLVSIHRNFYQGDSKSGQNTAKGVECWIGASNPSDANKLSTDILNELMKLSITTNRGVKTGTINDVNRNYKINTSKCTSCILELGFITNTGDDALVTTRRADCAKAIAQGIKSYLDSLE